MTRYLIVSAFLAITFPSLGQDVLYLSNGTNLTIAPRAFVTIQGGLYAESSSSVLNMGDLYLSNNSVTNKSDWTDKTAGGVFAAESNGMVYFQSAGGHYIQGNTAFPSLTLDAAGGITLDNIISVVHYLILKKGKLNTGTFKLAMLNSAADAVQADAGNINYANSWVAGKLQRNILANTATYDFPVGNNTHANLLQFINNNINGPSALTSSFGPKPGDDAGLVITENGTPYTSVNDAGVWLLDADREATAGKYALQLYFNGFTDLTDNKFGVLRRPDASSSAADWTVPEGSALEPANGPGRKVSDGYARRINISSFSQLGIGMAAVALPISLVSFTALRESTRSVNLTWITATETNNKGFEIERKFENENQFVFVRFENSKALNGYSQAQLLYTFHDQNAYSGVTYYRIKQIDKDNQFFYTAIKAVRGMGNTSVEVALMPNPSRGQFKIYITGVSSAFKAYITSMNGQVVAQMVVNPEQEVNVQGLAPGTYVLTIRNAFGEGKDFKEKIVIIQ